MTAPAVIRVSRRVRRARILVAPRRPVEVVVPPGTSEAAVERLLQRHGDWIARRRAELENRPALGLDAPGTAWLDGRPVPPPPGDRERWYRRQARDRLTASVMEQSARLGLDGWRRIRIGDPRSRWGSCSARGTLSFSWRLVVAPSWVADYVVVHELCHLRHMNHSQRFWALLREAYPHHAEAQAWLRTHGPELLAFEP
jgi:predicted metal-dependent hydrolase